MILTKEVNVVVHRNNKKYYEGLGYDINKDLICVKIEHLSKGSHIKIDVCCDYCGKSKILKYNDYNFSISKGGKYSCSDCYSLKRKENSLKKYGVDSPNKLKLTQERKNKTVKEKYGVENISEISQDKVRKTKLEKYGDEKYNNRDKVKITSMERYGVSNYTNTIEY